MKSFFDFIGRTEASRGARRWSWTLISVQRFSYKSFKGRGQSRSFYYFLKFFTTQAHLQHFPRKPVVMQISFL
ncbi:hypothetical protein [Mesobacillus sp.]|uniref:hypothetical protein n=1 Tax=Mesobacillus sp. TaxID=2675271 RepID=UPI0039EE5D85